MKNKFYNFVRQEEMASLYIYGDIGEFDELGEVSAKGFKEELDMVDGLPLTVYINSFGGSVNEGLAIGNMLKRRKGETKAVIDSFACSIASIIACSCETVEMYSSSMLMCHNALCGMVGNAQDMRKMADDLDRISDSLKQVYLEKAGDKLTFEHITELMDAESWLSAQQCLELGLCDRIIDGSGKKYENKTVLLNHFKNKPLDLMEKQKVVDEPVDKVDGEPIKNVIDEEIEFELELMKIQMSL